MRELHSSNLSGLVGMDKTIAKYGHNQDVQYGGFFLLLSQGRFV